MSDPILHTIRRELKRIAPDVRISVAELKDALGHEVIKREAIEGEKATEAQRLVSRAASKALRQRKTKENDGPGDTVLVDKAADEDSADETA